MRVRERWGEEGREGSKMSERGGGRRGEESKMSERRGEEGRGEQDE